MDILWLLGINMTNFLFLSPHYDDVCFSLAFVASKLTNLKLINIFTNSTYAKPHILTSLPQGIDLASSVSQVRDREDAIFATRYNFERTNLVLDDAGLNGADPFDLNGIEEEHVALEKILLPVLKGKANKDSPVIIFCPLAVGGHKNHTSVFNVIADHIPELENQGINVCFYEDLPYSSYRDMRLNRIEQLEGYLTVNKYKRFPLTLDNNSIVSKRLVFSLEPRCQGLLGSQK